MDFHETPRAAIAANLFVIAVLTGCAQQSGPSTAAAPRDDGKIASHAPHALNDDSYIPNQPRSDTQPGSAASGRTETDLVAATPPVLDRGAVPHSGAAGAMEEKESRDASASYGAPALAARPELAKPAPPAHANAPMPYSPPQVFPVAPEVNTERYQHLDDNPVKIVASDPVSTFSLDVDTGSYSNVRRFLAGGQRPPQDAVRIEELVNYFPYDYPASGGRDPFGIRTELAPNPWNPEHWLLRVAVRADEVDAKPMPPANLVFLVDVSGSMDSPDKLPLLRQSLKLLSDQLRKEDRLSLVVYAGCTAVILEPTPGDQHETISRAIDQLVAGGSTAGEAGIRLAYRLARQGFLQGGINRVLLATDGDFNVGITDFEQVKDLVEHERETGVQLSTLGFGTGNYNDHLMEQLADTGNGSYAYIDNLTEGRKVLVDQMRSTLVTVAKDVKVQVEFNPAVVGEYRLIGYENRMLQREDFNNDRIDAGDVGAGQSVTALYELTPVGAKPGSDPLRYGAAVPAPEGSDRALLAIPKSVGEVAFVKLRYKQPAGTTSQLVEVLVEKSAMLASFAAAGDDFRFATAVAGFGQLLRGGKHSGSWSYDDVLSIATAARGKDEFGYRSEFLSLVRMAKVSG